MAQSPRQDEELPKRRYVPAAQTRASLLRAAADEFARHGVEGARVSRIVTQAGIHQPGFYRQFESKEAVHELIISEFRKRLRDLIANALIPPDFPADDLAAATRAAVRSLLAFLDEDRAATAVALFREPAGGHTRDELLAMIGANVTKEAAAGHFRADFPPMLFAECLIGIVVQLARKEPAGTGERDRQAELVAALLLNGIRRSGA